MADSGRAYGAAFRATPQVAHEQARVLRAIVQCRTVARGGHVEAGAACGTERVCSTSGRHRHCPKCQGRARAQWLKAEQALLLPVPSCHRVFTLPHQLTPLVRVNQRALYPRLFQAATQPLQEFARAPTSLRAALGITAVLHTGGQTLTEHLPGHCSVTGGGLSTAGTPWQPSHPRFRFAGTALSQVFPGKSLAALDRLRSTPRLTFAGTSAALVEDAAWAAFLPQLPAPPGVVYAKPPWGGPEQGLQYLSRSTPRVAIANARRVFVGNRGVRFRSKDSAAGGTTQVME